MVTDLAFSNKIYHKFWHLGSAFIINTVLPREGERNLNESIF